MDRKKVIAACRRAWGEGDLQTLTGGEGGYQWSSRESGKTQWLGYSLKAAYDAAERARADSASPPDSA
jgi:hypothetical protein